MEITETSIKEQSKVVANLGVELQQLEQQGVAGYQKQLKRMEDIALLRIKHVEETTIFNYMVTALGEARAGVRIKGLVVSDNTGQAPPES